LKAYDIKRLKEEKKGEQISLKMHREFEAAQKKFRMEHPSL